MDRGMVIVGAGECGVRAAFALREAGYAGPVALIGKESHLPYARPPLSKAFLVSDDVLTAPSIVARDNMEAHGIDFIDGNPVVAIDRVAKIVLLGNERAISYDKLLLATGAVPLKLNLACSSPRVAYLRTVDDALSIRSRLTEGGRLMVIGGGFIGLEVAASARRRGVHVVVVEAQPRILMRGVPVEVADVVHSAHSSAGVNLLCGESVCAFRESGGSLQVYLASGRTISADLVVVGIGVTPATDLAESTGLALDNGIVVDDRLQSSDPDIFAAGDCCSFPLNIYGGRRIRLESWRNAQEQGELAAKNMLGGGLKHAAIPWFWSDQYGLTLQVAGLPEAGNVTVRRTLENGAFIVFHLDDGRLVAASGIGSAQAVGRDIRVAEMLIAARSRPDLVDLASPQIKLKRLLAA